MNRRDFMQALTSGAMAAPLAAGMVYPFAKPHTSAAGQKETSFERVLRTGLLRCAWAAYTPSIIVDPNTRRLSGIFYELTSLVGQYLGLKVEWVEEVDYGLIPEGLKTGRYDLFGGAVSPTSERAKVSNFTNPVYISPYGLYVRTSEKRFTAIDEINQPACRIALHDGDLQDSIARASFPRATRYALPQMTAITQLLEDIVAGKADATFVEPFFADSFMKSNPGTLKNIATRTPVRVFGNTLMFDNDDWRLKTMLDTALQEIQGTGIVSKLIEKYTGSPHTFLLVAKPYDRNER
jgi:ABC-type amino acid transport substrate-binding protein